MLDNKISIQLSYPDNDGTQNRSHRYGSHNPDKTHYIVWIMLSD